MHIKLPCNKHKPLYESFKEFLVKSAVINAKSCHVWLKQPYHFLHSIVIAAFSNVSKVMPLPLYLFSIMHFLHQQPQFFYGIVPLVTNGTSPYAIDFANLPVTQTSKIIQ